MSDAARLLFPALRWDADTGFAASQAEIEAALELGVGGFILFGGEAGAVHALTTELQQRSRHPLLIAADLERGAGQQFEGATALPPLAALGHLDDEAVTELAGRLSAREARALGVNWIFAPVADVDLEPANPIVGTRAFSHDPKRAARHVRAWVRGCQGAGAIACAKHFPGHGRTTADSHAELPVVNADASALNQDLEPFKAAIREEVGSIMTAHVRYPALDVSGLPATLSERIVSGLLRDRLAYPGLIATDALIMEGVLEGGGGEESAALGALEAGCDCLLYPRDVRSVARAIGQAAPEKLEAAIRRVRLAAETVPAAPQAGWAHRADQGWARETALRSLHWVRGQTGISNPVEVYTVDDDLGGPYPPPSRATFLDGLRSGGVEAIPVDQPSARSIVAVYCDVRAWKRRPGLSDRSIQQVKQALEAGADLVVLFAHPRIAGQTGGANVLCAWGGEPLMQEAAALRLTNGATQP